MGIIMFLPIPAGVLTDKVFGYKRRLRFKGTAPHVSRDFASFEFSSDFDRGNIV